MSIHCYKPIIKVMETIVFIHCRSTIWWLSIMSGECWRLRVSYPIKWNNCNFKIWHHPIGEMLQEQSRSSKTIRTITVRLTCFVLIFIVCGLPCKYVHNIMNGVMWLFWPLPISSPQPSLPVLWYGMKRTGFTLMNQWTELFSIFM